MRAQQYRQSGHRNITRTVLLPRLLRTPPSLHPLLLHMSRHSEGRCPREGVRISKLSQHQAWDTVVSNALSSSTAVILFMYIVSVDGHSYHAVFVVVGRVATTVVVAVGSAGSSSGSCHWSSSPLGWQPAKRQYRTQANELRVRKPTWKFEDLHFEDAEANPQSQATSSVSLSGLKRLGAPERAARIWKKMLPSCGAYNGSLRPSGQSHNDCKLRPILLIASWGLWGDCCASASPNLSKKATHVVCW